MILNISFRDLLPIFLFLQLLENLPYLAALQVLTDPAQQKVLGGAESNQSCRRSVVAVGLHLTDEHPLAHVLGEKLGQPVDQTQGGDGEEGEPPVPDDEEVVLVEQVVGQQAEDVGLVGVAGGSSSQQRAGHHGGEEVAQRVHTLRL